MTEDSDAALLNRVETRGQREQRALSRAIEAKENGKCGWRNREGHVDERLTRPITMAHALDGQRRRVDCCHCVHLRRCGRLVHRQEALFLALREGRLFAPPQAS